MCEANEAAARAPVPALSVASLLITDVRAVKVISPLVDVTLVLTGIASTAATGLFPPTAATAAVPIMVTALRSIAPVVDDTPITVSI